MGLLRSVVSRVRTILFDDIHRIVSNGRVQLVVGLLLLVFALIPIFTSYFTLHHSVFLMIVYHVWGAIPNILQALERIGKGDPKKEFILKERDEERLIHEDDYIAVYVTDEKGAGGAYHEYEVVSKETGEVLDTVSFQNGPIQENGVNGSTNEALLAIVFHRLSCFQEGPFPSYFNVKALSGVHFAKTVLEARTTERKQRNVEGKHQA